MVFRLREKETIGPGLIRLVADQLEKAVRQLDTLTPDPEAAIHKVRQRCKRARAIFRLLRAPLGPARYESLSALVRDTGRALAGVRDADVMLAWARDFARTDTDWLPIACELERRRLDQCGPVSDEPALLVQSAVTLNRVRVELLEARLPPLDQAQLHRALRRDYRRARHRLPEPDLSLQSENWHNFRKAVKTHGLQLEVFRRLLPVSFRHYRKDLLALGELLGCEHDLHVLANTLAGSPDAFGEGLQRCHWTLNERRRQYQSDALVLGQRLFRESPGKFVKHLDLRRV